MLKLKQFDCVSVLVDYDVIESLKCKLILLTSTDS
jgi:hypothetical protein